MPRVFAITAANTTIKLDQAGHGEASFTVSNTTKRPLRGRARAVPLDSANASWLSVAGEAERDFGPDSTHQFTVQIVVPSGTPPGRYTFNIVVASTDNPDEEYAEGPAVAFESTAAEVKKKPFPWWILVVVGAVIVIGIVAVILITRKPSSPPLQAARIRPSTIARIGPSTIALIDAAPSARWTANAGGVGSTIELPWSGSDGDSRGFALWRDNATLEDGSTQPRVLETHPQWAPNGEIIGAFELAWPIENGDRFKAQVGFLKGATAGQAEFVVSSNHGGSEIVLAQVPDSGNDGVLKTIDVDLSQAAGARLVVLTVKAGPTAAQDWAVWVAPRIERQGGSH